MLKMIIIFLLLFQSLSSSFKQETINISIGGIFKVNSPSERAFRHAVERHNAVVRQRAKTNLSDENKYKRFMLVPRIALLQELDSTVVTEKVCQLAGTTAVFGGGNFSAVAEDVIALASTLQLPVFLTEEIGRHFVKQDNSNSSENDTSGSTSDGTNGTNANSDDAADPPSHVLQLYPSVNEAIVDYLIQQDWRTFSYICNSGQCLYRLQRLIKLIHARLDYVELNVDVRYISDVRLASKDLRNLNEYLSNSGGGGGAYGKMGGIQQKRVLIDMETEESLRMLLNRVVLMGMNRPEYSYVVVGLEFGELNLDDFQYSGVNITGFHAQLLPNSDEGDTYQNFVNSWKRWNLQHRIQYTSAGSVIQAALMEDALSFFVEVVSQMLQTKEGRNLVLKTGGTQRNVDCYTYTGLLGSTETAGGGRVVNGYRRRRVFGYQNGRYEVKPSLVGRSMLQLIWRTQITGLTGNIEFAKSTGQRKNYLLSILSMEMDKGVNKIGEWCDKHGGYLNISRTNKNIITVQRIKTSIVRVVSIEAPPFLQHKKPKNGEKLEGNDRFEGFCVDLLNMTARSLNFKYSIQLVKDNAYGEVVRTLSNGTPVWNGMIGELLRREADIAVAPLTINLARAKVVHFSEPFLTFGLSLMIKKPGRKNPGIFSFMRPLADTVWGCYFAASLVVALGLFVITRLSPYEWTVSDKHDSNCDDSYTSVVVRSFTFYNSVWFSFAALVQQGVDIVPKSPGARILSSVWWFFTLIMTAYYTANLVAFLTISLIITPINDFGDLLKPLGIKFGTTNSGSTKNFFLTTNLSPFREMGNIMQDDFSVFTDSVHQGYQRVLSSKGKYAFILESRMNEYYNNREPCETMMVGTPFGDKGYGIATPLDYPMKDELNDAVLRLRENQELDRLYKSWWIKKGGCVEDNSQSRRRQLTLINVAGVFYILTSGLAAALLTSLLEFLYNARRNFRQQAPSFSLFLHQRARMSIHGPDIDSRPLRLAYNN